MTLEKGLLRGALQGSRSLFLGLLGTLLLAMVGWIFTVPMGTYSCWSYATNTRLPDWHYQPLDGCYVKDHDRWFTKEERQRTMVGARVIMEHLQ